METPRLSARPTRARSPLGRMARALRSPRPLPPRTSLATRRAPRPQSLHEGIPNWLRRSGMSAWYIIGLCIVVYFAFTSIARIDMVFIAIFLALVVSSILLPIVNWLSRFMPQVIAVIATVLVTMASVAAMIFYVVTSVVDQIPHLTGQFQYGAYKLLDFLESDSSPFSVSRSEVIAWANKSIREGTQYVRENAATLAGEVLSNASVIALIMTVLALSAFVGICLLLSGDKMWLWFVNQLPAHVRERTHRAACAGWYTFSGYARGTMIVAGSDALFAFIFLSILGIPLAAPLGLLVLIGAFIPLIGAPAAMLVAMIVALASKGLMAMLIVGIGITLIGQFEGHVLQPLVMGKQVSLHPMVVAVGVAAGTFWAGLIGAFLAIPLIAVCWAVYNVLRPLDPPESAPLPTVREVMEATANLR
ncbi:AI-2E family transporter [Buchananella hordeovulneris]|nr:AI-2E family transporter [Buchananella hordeovulneris]